MKSKEPKIVILDSKSTLVDFLIKNFNINPLDIIHMRVNLDQLNYNEAGIFFFNSELRNTFALCRKVKKNNKLKSIPIVFYNFSNKPEVIKALVDHKALPISADYYLFPPIVPEMIKPIIKKYYIPSEHAKEEVRKATNHNLKIDTPVENSLKPEPEIVIQSNSNSAMPDNQEIEDIGVPSISNFENYIISIQKEFKALKNKASLTTKEYESKLNNSLARISELEEEVLKLKQLNNSNINQLKSLHNEMIKNKETFQKLEQEYQTELKEKGSIIEQLKQTINGQTSKLQSSDIKLFLNNLKTVSKQLNEFIEEFEHIETSENDFSGPPTNSEFKIDFKQVDSDQNSPN